MPKRSNVSLPAFEGRLYTLHPKTSFPDLAYPALGNSAGHPFLVISHLRSGVVEAMPITSSTKDTDYTNYIPIAPAKKLRKRRGIQLHLSQYGLRHYSATVKLDKDSYIRIDRSFELPTRILKQMTNTSSGHELRLTMDSLRQLQRYLEWNRTETPDTRRSITPVPEPDNNAELNQVERRSNGTVIKVEFSREAGSVVEDRISPRVHMYWSDVEARRGGK